MAVIASDTTRSGLDEIFYSGYEMDKQPGEVRADDTLFFRQTSTPWGTIQYAESQGPGDFTEEAEESEVPEATVRVGNKTTADVLNYKRDLPISEEYREDSEKYGTVDQWVKEMGIRARTSRDKFAMRRSYGDAFGGVNTPDGADLISNSHTSLNGDTIDNLETGALSPANLEVVVRSLRLQRAQDGDLASYHADGLLVPVVLHPDATEITASELKAGTAQNEINYWSKIYPGLRVGASEYLDSTYNTLNTNANTSYFVVSKMHSITRAVRVALETEWVDPIYDRKRRAFYRARFRERVYAGTWGGVVGSNGTA